jgi:methylmalonyl-CoA epimerase
MRIKGIHRVTVAVRDLAAARATFERLFGASLQDEAAVPAFDVRAVDLAFGDDTVQLAEPLGADNPVTRFLERKGEGFYNIALEVEDLDGAIAELTAQGVRVSAPVEAEPGLRSSFVAMAATHGLSVQLVERVAEDAAPEAAPSPQRSETAAVAEAEERQQPLDLTPDEWSDLD